MEFFLISIVKYIGKLHTKSSKRNAFTQKNKKKHISILTLFLHVSIKFYLIVKKCLTTLNKNKK